MDVSKSVYGYAKIAKRSNALTSWANIIATNNRNNKRHPKQHTNSPFGVNDESQVVAAINKTFGMSFHCFSQKSLISRIKKQIHFFDEFKYFPPKP